MVIRPPASDTFRGPAADVAVLDRLGVRVGWRIGRGDLVGHRSKEAIARRSVGGHVVVDPEALDGAGAPAESHVHPLWAHARDRLEQVDVRTDLEHGAGLPVAPQL